MSDMLKAATEKTAGLARQTTLYASNAFDRVFRAASLVKAGQTPFETLHTDGLVSLRYYPPLQEDFIELDGWSLGGMFTLFYAGLSKDQNIRNAIILGAPIDSHASGILGLLSQGLGSVAEFVHKRTGFQVHDLRPHWFHSPGWLNTIGFKLTNPIGSVMGYWELIIRLGDREFVTNHATTAAFLDRMAAYPGGIVQDTVVRIWMDNELSRGTWASWLAAKRPGKAGWKLRSGWLSVQIDVKPGSGNGSSRLHCYP